MVLPSPNFELGHRLHGLLPITQPGLISIYRALKQRPGTDRVATRFDIPVTPDTKPGWLLQEIYNLWPDLSNSASRAFQLIPILHRFPEHFASTIIRHSLLACPLPLS